MYMVNNFYLIKQTTNYYTYIHKLIYCFPFFLDLDSLTTTVFKTA